MAGPPPVALLLGAAAAFFLLSKKGNGASAAPKSDDPGGEKKKPDTKMPAAPKAKSQDELEQEYEPDGGIDGEVPVEEIIAKAQWKKWPPDSQLSGAVGDHGMIFASEDCESALIGRDWSPVIEFEDKLYDPALFWKTFADGVRPNEVVEEIGTSNVRWFTSRLLVNKNSAIDCEVEIPLRKDYESEEDYTNGWTGFLNSAPGFADLFQQIYHLHVKAPMMAAWAEADPDAYTDYKLHEMALWAVDKYPNEDVTEQTDQAYFSWIEGMDAPKVLDPDNPAHEEYVELWLELNQAIKAL